MWGRSQYFSRDNEGRTVNFIIHDNVTTGGERAAEKIKSVDLVNLLSVKYHHLIVIKDSSII